MDTTNISSNSSTNYTPFDLILSGENEDEYNHLFEFIIMGIGITTASVLGIFGNIISACVLSRPQMKSSVSCLLLGLTFADSVLILASGMIFGLPVLFTFNLTDPNELNFYMAVVYPILGPYIYAIALTGQTASVYFTVAVTIERYLVVCYPLQARSLCTWARARHYSAGVLVFSILYNLPRWLELKAVKKKSMAYYTLEFTDFRLNTIYSEYYINWAYLVIMCLLPFAVLVTLNATIHRKIITANKERHDLTGGPVKNQSFSMVLLCVVTTFLLCNVLALIINLLECIWKIKDIDLENLSNFLVTLNSSVNCAIYCLVGHKFREQLIHMKDEFRVKSDHLRSRISQNFQITTVRHDKEATDA